MTEQYIIGSGIPPDWAKEKLLPYQKTDGSVGYEFYGIYRIFYLAAGDKLVFSKGKIDVRQQRKEKFNEKVD